MVFTAEFGGVKYTFDPEKQAMKEAGITELTPKNRELLARKILEHAKVGRRRAYVGAITHFYMEKALKGEPTCPALISLALLSR